MSGLFANDYNLNSLEEITIERFDFNLFVTPRFRNHFLHSVYEETTALIIRQNVKGVNTFIDVGAHYGFYNVLVGLSNPQCKILAFEPVPENCTVLRKNLELNNIDASVFQAAVSDGLDRDTFQISEASDNSGLVANPSVNVSKHIEIDVVQLDQYLPQIPKGPVLIKIDTEGNELKVLNGMHAIIDKCNDLRLIIEFNPKCLEANGESPQTLLDRLFKLGFDIFFIYDEERQYKKFNQRQKWRDFIGKKTHINLYCIKKKNAINLLFFSHSSGLAGAERNLLGKVKALISNYGSIVTVVMPSSGRLGDLLQEAGAAIIIAPLNHWCSDAELPTPVEIKQHYYQSFNWLNENLSVLGKINPDIILTNTLVFPWGAMAAFLLKRPHIWLVNEFGELDHGLNFYLPFSQVLSFIDEYSDKIVTCSKAIQKELFPNLGHKKIKTIYSIIEFPDKKSLVDVSIDNIFLMEDAFHIIIYGTVAKSKGQEDAVRAVIDLVKNREYEVELVIAGYANPGYRSYLQEIINNEGVADHIHIIPFQENILSIVSLADVVLVCSRMEGFGRVTLEAMLLEKAVIATNTGGTLEMIADEETGLLYSPGNHFQLANQIEELINNSSKRKKLAKNAGSFSKKSFSNKKSIMELRKLFMELKYMNGQNKGDVLSFFTDQYQILLEKKDLEVEGKEAEISDLKLDNVEKEKQIQTLTAEKAVIVNSKAWRFVLFIRKMIYPSGSTREKIAHLIYSSIRILRVEGIKILVLKIKNRLNRILQNKMPNWFLQRKLNQYKLFDESRKIESINYKPLISVLLPTYNTSVEHLVEVVNSVRDQTYENWEICICDDGSYNESTIDELIKIKDIDERIKLVFLEENCGISIATNKAAHIASGEFLALLDHDDMLTKDALFEIILALNDEEVDILYSDQDKINIDGSSISEPFFKPDWSPIFLRTVMYVGHLLVVRTELYNRLGGMNSQFDGVQDYEFMLRVSETNSKVKHISKILYHWRKIPGSIAFGLDEKGEKIEKLQVKAVNEHLNRLGLNSMALKHPKHPHRVLIKPKSRDNNPLVSIVILSKDAPEYIGRCLYSIFNISAYPNYEVIIVDNGTTDIEAINILNKYPLKIIPFNNKFNYSKANNIGVQNSNGEFIILLNNDTEVITPTWIEELLTYCELPNIGAVGPLLLYPDKTVQHAGVVIGIRGTADHDMRHVLFDSDGYAGSLSCPREVSAVTGACLMIKKEDYINFGGLVEYYNSHYQDVDFCLRLHHNQKSNLFVPYAVLFHNESVTRGDYYDYIDRALLLDTWGDIIAKGDPFFNRNRELK